MSDAEVADATTDEPAAPEPDLVHGAPASWSGRQRVVHPSRADYVRVVGALADEGYGIGTDLCGVDYLTHPGRTLPDGVVAERFEVVVNLIDIEHGRRIRVRLQVPESDPVVPSLFDLYPGLEAFERETYDMFGIAFEGHPDLTRILMPEDWVGHPLRKDYEVGRIPVQFKDTPERR